MWWSVWVACRQPEPEIVVVVRTEEGGSTTEGDGGDAGNGGGNGGGGGGGGGPESDAPQIEALRLEERANDVLVQVDVLATAPVETLLLTVDGDELEFDVTSPVTEGTLSTTISRERVGECVEGGPHEFTAQVVDAGGERSARVTEDLETEGAGVVLAESGAAAIQVGAIGDDELFCGRISNPANDGYAVTGDWDVVRFSTSARRSLTATLDWTTASDFDLWLVWDDGTTSWIVEESQGGSTSGPELVAAVLEPGSDYELWVLGWSGDPGDWSLRLE